MGRPKIDIDEKAIQKLASLGLKNTEIADFFGVAEATIRRKDEILRKGRAELHKSLRKKQIEVALKGNATMLIWLGKNILDQSDKNEIDVNVDPTEIVKEFAKMVALAGAGQATPSNKSIPDGPGKIQDGSRGET